MNRKIFPCLLFSIIVLCNYSQKLSMDAGFKFNNDFTTIYKDFKPFYYSGITYDLMWKHKRAEYILGIRYMPYLNAIKPDIGFNYYLHPNEEAHHNYFFHTSVFFNNYSYNTLYGYENYNYQLIGIKPKDYNEVYMTSFMQDFGIGFKIGLTRRLAWKMVVGGGYYYGKNEQMDGTDFGKTLKDHYWGGYYSVRFSLKYVLYVNKEKDPEEADEVNGLW